MNGRVAMLGAFVHAIVALVIITAATVLAALHDLDGQTVAALFGTAVGLLGGSASSLGTLYTAVNGKSVVSAEALAGRETTLREAISSVATSTPQTTKLVPAPTSTTTLNQP